MPLVILHTLCAFANDIHNLGGGYILIGVAEHNGRPVLPPVGLDPAQIDAIQKELLNLGFSAIAPYYHPIAVPVEIDGRHVLVPITESWWQLRACPWVARKLPRPWVINLFPAPPSKPSPTSWMQA